MGEIALPDLSEYRLHRVIEDVDFEGTPIPGLTGTFYRRDLGELTASVGVYRFADDQLFWAWGYVGEQHCRYTRMRRPDGTWEAARRGCPSVGVLTENGRVTGLALRLRTGDHVVEVQELVRR